MWSPMSHPISNLQRTVQCRVGLRLASVCESDVSDACDACDASCVCETSVCRCLGNKRFHSLYVDGCTGTELRGRMWVVRRSTALAHSLHTHTSAELSVSLAIQVPSSVEVRTGETRLSVL